MLRSAVDRAFLRYARTGDPGALGRVFDGSAGELYRLGFHLLGDRHAAEDLVQHTFVVAIEQASSFDRSRRVLPWLCGILTNRALHLRRQSKQRAASEGRAAADRAVDPAAEAGAREAEALVAAAVRSLDEPYRQVLLLHLVHELAPKDIAEALARPDATVRTQLARGLELLRKVLPASIAGLAAGQVPPPVGLKAVRAAVIARAAQVAPAAVASAIGVMGFTGVVAMKKVLLVGVALLAVLSSLPWWRSDPVLPANADAREKPAANVVAQSVPVAAPPLAATAAPRTEAPRAIDPATAALEVLVLWHDGTKAADIPVRVRPRPPEAERWLRVVRTGEDGIAHFTGLPPGAANALTGRGTKADLELQGGAQERATITLAQGIDVRGRVVDLDGRPVAGATVWMSVTSNSDDSEPVALTGPDGAFAIRGAGQQFVVTATAKGLGCAREAWVGQQGEELVLTLRPTPGVLVGTVVDASGRPVAGARLLLGISMGTAFGGENSRIIGMVSGQDFWPSRFLRTDDDGRFRSEGLPALPWPLWVGAAGFAPCWQVVDVLADRETEVAVRVGQGASVRGRITEAGVGVAGVVVGVVPDLPAPHELIGLGMARTPAPSWVRMRATTDAEGCYLLSQVMAGNAVLQAWHGTSRSKARVAREFVEGETFVWDAELEPEEEASWQRFEGSLVDEDGEPLGSWELRVGDPRNARNREAPYNRIHVGDTGTFRTNRVAPGTYELFVQPVQPKIGGEVGIGRFDVASCPLRIVVPRAHVPTSRLRGRVVAPPSLAFAGNPRCYVWVVPEGAGRADRVKCDAEGRYEAGPLQRGRYRLRAVSSVFGEAVIGAIEVVDGRDVDAGTFQAPMPGT
ncbi:MAG TPA: sigma-70 family RNA polymerase sigma factor, partial [Planctomycetota bacterium]